MQADPHSRVHQEKINNLRQEIESILKVLTEQHDCLEALQSKLNRGIFRDDSRDREREFYILIETISSLEEKSRNFEQMAKIASNLAAFVRRSPKPMLRSDGCFIYKANTGVSTEHPPHRVQQRPARSRYPCLHHGNNHLPPSLVRCIGLRNEHRRHTQYEHSAMALLGLCNTVYYTCHGLVDARCLPIRTGPQALAQISGPSSDGQSAGDGLL